jgi:uncharacterized protein YraI
MVRVLLITCFLAFSATTVRAGEWIYEVVGIAPNDVLNVRSGASTNYPIVGFIPPNGNYITVHKRDGGWCEVFYTFPGTSNGVHGWVNSTYLHRDRYCETECTQ